MYEIVVERTEIGFKGSCPALPGCIVEGTSKEDVLERMYLAIPEHVERARVEGYELPSE